MMERRELSHGEAGAGPWRAGAGAGPWRGGMERREERRELGHDGETGAGLNM
jgi:hypothetical protein